MTVRGDFPISQDFGENPKAYAKFGLKGHNGQDIACPVGTDIFSPIDGICVIQQTAGGYGLYARITEVGNKVRRQIVLGHLSKITYKAYLKGEMSFEVKAGEKIALSGNTGNSTGAHLHWGLRRLSHDGYVLNSNNGYAGYENIFKKKWITENKPSKY